MEGRDNGCPLFVNEYAVAWRIETIDDGIHRGFEYVRSESNINYIPEWLTNALYQILLGSHEKGLGGRRVFQRQRCKGEMLFIDTDGP